MQLKYEIVCSTALKHKIIKKWQKKKDDPQL
jgi:hypothetical protein